MKSHCSFMSSIRIHNASRKLHNALLLLYTGDSVLRKRSFTDKVKLHTGTCAIVRRLLNEVLVIRWRSASWSASWATTPINCKNDNQEALPAKCIKSCPVKKIKHAPISCFGRKLMSFEQEGQNFWDTNRYFIQVKQDRSQLRNYQADIFVYRRLLLRYMDL